MTTTFFDTAGMVVGNQVDSLGPNANLTMSAPYLLSNGGSATVVGSQDLAVVVVQRQLSPVAIDSYAGISAPSQTVQAPIAQNNNSGWFSHLYIQNTSTTPTDAAIYFYNQSGSNVCGTWIPQYRTATGGDQLGSHAAVNR